MASAHAAELHAPEALGPAPLRVEFRESNIHREPRFALTMASRSSDPPIGGLDDLFDYDVDLQDVFHDANVAMDVPVHERMEQTKYRDRDLGLGIDEEIKVTKKKTPVPKLDENRLLSQAGIPKLRRLAKERLEFKGKGHEFSDLASLLNVYQFWLDDLYPRAKFADGLAIIEKLGHAKRLQVMRREWINEGKPQDKRADADVLRNDERGDRASEGTENIGVASTQTRDPARSNLPWSPGSDDEDRSHPTHSDPPQALNADHNPDIRMSDPASTLHNTPQNNVPEDDLDVLLAETGTQSSEHLSADSVPRAMHTVPSSTKQDDYDDDMEAMAEIDNLW